MRARCTPSSTAGSAARAGSPILLVELPRLPRDDDRRLPRPRRAVQRQPPLQRRRGRGAPRRRSAPTRSCTTAGSAPLLAEADLDGAVLIDVDDGSGGRRSPAAPSSSRRSPAGADVDRSPAPSPDDRYLVCTGGTTGPAEGGALAPGRRLRVGHGRHGRRDRRGDRRRSPRTAPACGSRRRRSCTPRRSGRCSPALHNGATVVLHDDSQPFDARTILETAERERVTLMTIVGDAYARPLVEELRRTDYDLVVARQHRDRGRGHEPGAEGGAARPRPAPHRHRRLRIVRDRRAWPSACPGRAKPSGGSPRRRARPCCPRTGRGSSSRATRRSAGPPASDASRWATSTTAQPPSRPSPIVDGQRVSVPGDRATLAADGTIAVLGRDSMVVNTGGEKVFVEEVEEAIRLHPDVLDALVVGRPSERFGEEVVALVQLAAGRRARRPGGAGVRGAVGGAVQGAARGARVRPPRPPPVGQARLPVGPRGRDRRRARLLTRRPRRFCVGTGRPGSHFLRRIVGLSGLGDLEVGVAELEGLLRAVLGPGLDEVELVRPRTGGSCRRRGRGSSAPPRPGTPAAARRGGTPPSP